MTDHVCENCKREINKSNYPQHGDFICWGSPASYADAGEFISASEFIKKYIR